MLNLHARLSVVHVSHPAPALFPRNSEQIQSLPSKLADLFVNLAHTLTFDGFSFSVFISVSNDSLINLQLSPVSSLCSRHGRHSWGRRRCCLMTQALQEIVRMQLANKVMSFLLGLTSSTGGWGGGWEGGGGFASWMRFVFSRCVAENKVRQQDEEEGRWGRVHSWNTECEDLGLLPV